MKILYEITYVTRGQSGIPRDTKGLAQILLDSEKIESDFLLNPRSYTRRRRNSDKNLKWSSNELGDSLRREPGRSAIPPIVVSVLILFQSLSLNRKVYTKRINDKYVKNAFSFIGLRGNQLRENMPSILVMSVSYLARFVRPSFLAPFKIDTKEYDVFVQQQVDPITVGRKTTHVVRLHDFLPISHPHFFDQNAVKIFSKSLKLMLKGRDKIWVMDSDSTAREFQDYFGPGLNVSVIPCFVEVIQAQTENEPPRKNQICMVNTIEPRKQVSLGIAGFLEGKKSGLIPQDWELIVVGNEGWQEKSLALNLRHQSFGTDVIFKEGAQDFELQKVYQQSKIVISCSAAEGFGLPPLEGMANGCVPVLSNIPQHRETVSNLGIYFDGDTPENVASAISEAIKVLEQNQEEVSKEMIKHVRENYSKELIARKWIDLFASLKK
jgi:glycosyltransferase involved in cell wall biosynthesis